GRRDRIRRASRRPPGSPGAHRSARLRSGPQHRDGGARAKARRGDLHLAAGGRARIGLLSPPRAAMIHWHLLTGEFPPQRGGVSDYVWSLSGALAGAGDDVHVWCPPTETAAPAPPSVSVHRSLGRLEPRDLRAV